MGSYQRRVVDDEVDVLLPELPALCLNGPKAVGKTETSSRRAATVLRLDDPVQQQLLAADPGRILTMPQPVLLDEWQRVPAVWDVVRRAVDDGAAPGSFLLTGSASPHEAPTHSGAGRIVSLRMRPLSLAERGLDVPSVSLAGLLTGSRPLIDGSSAVGLPQYAEEVVRSGLPGLRGLSPRVRRSQLDSYLARVIERDFPEQGHLVRRPALLRGWLQAYARASATTASYTSILDDALPGDTDKPAKTTTTAYRDVLSQLWLLDPVEAWLPRRGFGARLVSVPKHHLADPAFAARLLGLDDAALLTGGEAAAARGGGPLLGALFESLVTLSLQTYAQAAEAAVHHLRTRNGDHEVDLLVVRDDGRVLAAEVKLSASVTDADVRHLLWLRDRLGADLLDAVVITTGQHAYRRTDGVAVVPAALLGP